jgi:hypothetical protein
MDEFLINDIEKFSADENAILKEDFTDKEVFEAISQMGKNKAAGLDGFPAELFPSVLVSYKGISCGDVY